MSAFVDTCRKEWDRLGVPEGVANEMAADLEVDLTEADADGVSPEAVLGNGYFDPEAFAASWATERGVVSDDHRRGATRLGPWRLASWSLVSAVVAMLGLAMLVGVRHSSVAVAGAAFRRPMVAPVPGIFIGPHHFSLVEHSGVLVAVALGFLLAGLVGLGITLWFWWRWSTRRRRPGSDRDIGMPSYI
jgi:hypothetical protein